MDSIEDGSHRDDCQEKGELRSLEGFVSMDPSGMINNPVQ